MLTTSSLHDNLCILTESKHDVRQAAAGEGDGEDYATITTPDTSGYQELEMSRR